MAGRLGPYEVTDAHGPFRNLFPEELDRRAHLVRGRPQQLGMLGGLDEQTDAVLLAGYHARASGRPDVLTGGGLEPGRGFRLGPPLLGTTVVLMLLPTCFRGRT